MDYFDENYEPTTTSQTWRPPRGPFDEHVKAVLKAAALAPFTGEDPPALIRLGTETEVAGQLVEMLGGSDRAVYDRMQVRVFDPSGGWLQVEDGVLERAIMAFDGFTYTPESSPDKKRQLRVSNRMVAGVCGGLAEYFNIDPSLIRIIWAIGTLSTMGMGILAYIIAAIVLPEE